MALLVPNPRRRVTDVDNKVSSRGNGLGGEQHRLHIPTKVVPDRRRAVNKLPEQPVGGVRNGRVERRERRSRETSSVRGGGSRGDTREAQILIEEAEHPQRRGHVSVTAPCS